MPQRPPPAAPERTPHGRCLPGIGLLALVSLLVPACGGSDPGSTAPPGPDVLQPLGGAGSEGLRGTLLPGTPTVRLVDAGGAPRAGVPVTFEVTAGGGRVVEPSNVTDGAGRASALWILGWESGPQRLRVRAGEATAEFSSTARAPGEAARYEGEAGYVEYLPGGVPVILSAGHGGELRPAAIPDRTGGTTVQDLNTLDLALRVREALAERLGGYPHLVVSHLHRVKLDPNRELGEAAEGNPAAERAWWDYHSFLDAARRQVEEEQGGGLYVDLHGHGHAIPRVELGYLLSGSTLALDDAALSAPANVERSSLRSLVAPTGPTLAELLRGPASLGARLEGEGVPAVPSPGIPHPAGDPYFTGGYSTARHGSRDGGRVSGVQVEAHFPGIRDTPENRSNFAEVLAGAVAAFLQDHPPAP